MDFNLILGVGISVVIGEADIKRGTEVSVGDMAASGSAGACAAENGAAALFADGAGAAARLEADNEINPLTTNVMMNKNVANAVANRKTGTARGVGGLMPAIVAVKVKLRGARREGSWRRKARVERKLAKAVRRFSSEARRDSSRAESDELSPPSKYAERSSRSRGFMIVPLADETRRAEVPQILADIPASGRGRGRDVI